MKINWEEIWEDLDTHRTGSWRSLGRSLDIPASTFTRLKNGQAIKAEHVLTIMEWLNTDLRVYRVYKMPTTTTARTTTART